MKRLVPTIASFAVALAACAGSGVAVIGDAAIQPSAPDPVLEIVVVAGDDGGRVAAAEVAMDRGPLVTDESGVASVDWNGEPLQFAVSAPGFETAAADVVEYPEESEGRVEVTLAPLVLEGTVVGPDQRPLPATEVSLNGRAAVTDAAGRFSLTRALPGEIAASRPAWETGTASWDGEVREVTVTMQPKEIHALRVSGDKAADPKVWGELLDLAATSKVNAFVVDTKDESGWVFRETSVPLVEEAGSLNESFMYDVEQVLRDMDEAGLYKITRVTTFQDNFVPKVRPEWAIRNEDTGGIWQNAKGIRWLDPTDRNSWEYPLALAVESCELGFDEIQFDYVRFPSDGDIRTVQVDGGYNEEVRTTTIHAFLTEAHKRLNPLGCAVAADIFAITLTSDWDEGIGQRPELLSQAIDVLSPMIYTYTYGPGWGGFDNPNEHPVEVVSQALDAGIPRLQGFSIYRPWIQTWQLDAGEILQVQAAVEERDLGWMIWSANTLYDSSFLPPE